MGFRFLAFAEGASQLGELWSAATVAHFLDQSSGAQKRRARLGEFSARACSIRPLALRLREGDARFLQRAVGGIETEPGALDELHGLGEVPVRRDKLAGRAAEGSAGEEAARQEVKCARSSEAFDGTVEVSAGGPELADDEVGTTQAQVVECDREQRTLRGVAHSSVCVAWRAAAVAPARSRRRSQ